MSCCRWNNFMKLALLTLLATSFLHAQLAQTAEPSYWRFANPEAQLLAGLNWKAIDGASPARSQWRAVGEMLGHVERLLISSPLPGEQGRSPANMLVIASGRFDLAQLQKAASQEGAVSRAFKGATLVGSPKPAEDEILIAYIDPVTALLGTKTIIGDALDRGATPRRGPLSEKNELFSTAADMAALNDFWVVSNVSQENGNDAKSPLRGMNAYATGFKLEDGVQLSLHLNMATEQLAEDSLTRLPSILFQIDEYFPGVIPAKKGLDLKHLIGSMKATIEEADLHAWSHIPSAQLAILQKKQTVLSAENRPPATPIASPRSESKSLVPSAMLVLAPFPGKPEAPKKPKVVRIEGLEDGPRIIPYGGDGK